MTSLRKRWQAWQPTNRQVLEVAKFMFVVVVLSGVDDFWPKMLWALVLFVTLNVVDNCIQRWWVHHHGGAGK